jgi:hypothetical protein
MQPTEPEPSSVEPATDVPVSTETSPDLSTQPSRAASFLQRLWRGRDGRGAGGGEDVQTEENANSPETPRTITLTQEEFDKRVDAETQRREAKRAQQAQAERKRRLRDEDPWAYAEEERNAEQHAMSDQQVSTLFSQIGAEHDKYSLDPLVQSLPAAERARILAMQGAGAGLEGRKLIVTEGLKALEKHWKAEATREAENRLRRNPAFRKQVLGEFRRGAPEPEFLDGGAASDGNQRVSDILRDQLRARH